MISRLRRRLRQKSLTTEEIVFCWNLYRQEPKMTQLLRLMKEEFKSIEVVRGGSVGIESISMMER